MRSSLKTHARTHTTNKTGGVPLTSVEIHPTVTLAKNVQLLRCSKNNLLSSLRSHCFLKYNYSYVQSKIGAAKQNSAVHCCTYEATGLTLECLKYSLMRNLVNEVKGCGGR